MDAPAGRVSAIEAVVEDPAGPDRRRAGDPGLVDTYTADRRLLSKATVTLYEDVQEFWVAGRADDGRSSAAARCM